MPATVCPLILRVIKFIHLGPLHRNKSELWEESSVESKNRNQLLAGIKKNTSVARTQNISLLSALEISCGADW